METFGFCPNGTVPATLPREPASIVSMNGWQFSARPSTPYQRRFKLTLHGLKWFLNPVTEEYDSTTSPTINARALELFYQAHETWAPFNWTHPHLGPMVVRFAGQVNIPPAIPNSDGLIEPLEITFIHHNPGY